MRRRALLLAVALSACGKPTVSRPRPAVSNAHVSFVREDGSIVIAMPTTSGLVIESTIASVRLRVHTCVDAPPCPWTCERRSREFVGQRLARDPDHQRTWLVAIEDDDEAHFAQGKQLKLACIDASPSCDPANRWMCATNRQSSRHEVVARLFRITNGTASEISRLPLELVVAGKRLDAAVSNGTKIDLLFKEADGWPTLASLPLPK